MFAYLYLKVFEVYAIYLAILGGTMDFLRVHQI
jgi:hypothetical protein